jgi:hypothetical protein
VSSERAGMLLVAVPVAAAVAGVVRVESLHAAAPRRSLALLRVRVLPNAAAAASERELHLRGKRPA